LPMWHYSMQGLPAIIVANNCRELLPHVFTFIPLSQESNFLWHFLLAPKHHPAVSRCIALCCPDFPSPKKIQER
jgi:hypothetical protein